MAAFGLPGGPEIWIILVVVLVIFGPTQLPKLAKMFGKSAKAMKDGIDGKLEEEDEKSAAADKAKLAEKDSDSDTSDKG
ncbi:MAG TPA: twin-arginine translocase TatA/TatE family subunit [Coriobacteriia bacterium]